MGIIDTLKLPARYVFEFARHNERVDDFYLLEPYFENKVGLEVGGMSRPFARVGIYPIYSLASRVDNCNATMTKKYHAPYPRFFVKGKDYTREATNLLFADESYDFVASCHVIEHIANPLKAMLESKRVLRKGGVILVICPHKGYTGDAPRGVTPLSHLIEDWDKNVDEHDMTHVADIDRGTYEKAHLDKPDSNFESRVMHQHTFIPETLIEMFKWCELEVIYVKVVLPHHIVIAGVKR
jgi:SAM-dependent methyltransferase